jgi:predicted transcriptional regulator
MKLSDEMKIIIVLYLNSVINQNPISITKLYHMCYQYNYNITYPAILRALKVLENKNIIETNKDGKIRYVKICEKGKELGKILAEFKKKWEELG